MRAVICASAGKKRARAKKMLIEMGFTSFIFLENARRGEVVVRVGSPDPRYKDIEGYARRAGLKLYDLGELAVWHQSVITERLRPGLSNDQPRVLDL